LHITIILLLSNYFLRKLCSTKDESTSVLSFSRWIGREKSGFSVILFYYNYTTSWISQDVEEFQREREGDSGEGRTESEGKIWS
jgi:hypothetical protein